MTAGLKTHSSADAPRGDEAVVVGGDPSSKDLKHKTVRGALVATVAQLFSLVLRTGSMMVLARLLLPEDFGLVGMVTAFTGFLGLFRDAGLSMAAVQRASISSEQMSTLFWINVAVGGLLAVACAAGAPLLVTFYGEPRLLWMAIALGASFAFNGLAAQHRAMLQRSMRFGALAIIETASLILSIIAGVVMAMRGCGYWSLVVMTVSMPAISVVGVWVTTGWIPGGPRRQAGIRSMLMYGGTVTLNNLIVYLAYNADKVLLGRFLGAETLGIYGRAYQLISLPTENLNSTIGQVAFPALSRVQDDPARLRSYFLQGYRLFLSLVMPLTMGCALFAEDIIRVFLGAGWHDAVPVFRLLAPTIVSFGLINPLAWLMLASGHAARSLHIALLIAPVVILSYALGLPFGPNGVAAGFSVALVLLAVPVVAWAKHGTAISTRDIIMTLMKPFLSVIVGAAATWPVHALLVKLEPALFRLVVESSILFGVYLLVLLFGFGQLPVYADLLRAAGFWPIRNRK